MVWTSARCVNPISRTKAKMYNPSEVGHLHPYISTLIKWFKKKWVFAHLSDITCHFSHDFWQSYSKRGLVCFSQALTCQQKVKPCSALSGFALPPGCGFFQKTYTKSVWPQENLTYYSFVSDYPLFIDGLMRLPYSTQLYLSFLKWCIILSIISNYYYLHYYCVPREAEDGWANQNNYCSSCTSQALLDFWGGSSSSCPLTTRVKIYQPLVFNYCTWALWGS